MSVPDYQSVMDKQLTQFLTPNWECLFAHRKQGLFLLVHVDDIKMAGKKQNLDPMWKLLNKELDLGEPTSP